MWLERAERVADGGFGVASADTADAQPEDLHRLGVDEDVQRVVEGLNEIIG